MVPSDENRCDRHSVGRCEECEKHHLARNWCTRCAELRGHGNYKVPTVGVGRYRRSSRENVVPIIHYGTGKIGSVLTTDMSSEGIFVV